MKKDIHIEIPAVAENVMPLRLFFSGIATRLGMDINQIDDIKSAISESCVMLMAGASGGVLTFDAQGADGLLIECGIDGFNRTDFDCDACSMSRLIFEAMADEAEFHETAGKITRITFRFGKAAQ